jgi:D-Tyr-tRNAtyr deacylase
MKAFILATKIRKKIQTGIYPRTNMKGLLLLNDGPVTILIDSKK